jgi:hypothetical protein
MGKITTCSTIMLSWSSGGITGDLEIDLVSATTGDMTVVNASIDLGSGITSYKWTVAAEPDVYYLEGNAADYPSLIYSGNFTVSAGSDTSCLSDKETSTSASASAAASSGTSATASQTAKATTGSNFDSGSDRIVVPSLGFLGIGVLAVALL